MKHVILADLVITHSHAGAKYLKEKLELTNRIEVIAHGCDLPKTVPPYPEEFIVGHLSTNGPDKGQIYLIDACKQLNGTKLLIAGYGTERWGGLGYIPDASALYKACTVYVQPTVSEGFSLTTLEAMAYARTVIVTEGAGVSELIEDGKDGFVVPIRDPEAIMEKIQYFLEQPNEVRRMGKNAREKAKQFEWSKIRKMYEEIFLEGS